MKSRIVILSIIFTLFSITLFAQGIRLSESNRVNVVDITVAPGINKVGDKIIQFNFIKFKKRSKEIDTKQMVFYTQSGKEIKLLDVLKDTTFISSQYSTSWYVTFRLSPEQINLLKSENVGQLVFNMGGKQYSRDIPISKAVEIKNTFVKYF